MIVPIVMLAIKDSAADMSPYVRKTAAHAIPKLYRLPFKNYIELFKISINYYYQINKRNAIGANLLSYYYYSFIIPFNI